MKAICNAAIVLILILFATAPQVSAKLPPGETLRHWIKEMKANPRGPFTRIRWFCNNGSILPPRPYACQERGGGMQHGQLSDQVARLRSGGYYIGNVLAALDINQITAAPGYSDLFNQILIENFLIAADDGWIFRKARFYRGAMQAENETSMARTLLLGLAGNDVWSSRGFAPLRIGASLLAHGVETAGVGKVRQHALALSEKDKNFLPLRSKIHNHLDRTDAGRVREYASAFRSHEQAGEYQRLADEIDKIFASHATSKRLRNFKKRLSNNSELAREMDLAVQTLETSEDTGIRFAKMSRILAKTRKQFLHIPDAVGRLAALDAGFAMEIEQYSAGKKLIGQLQAATRRKRLKWLQESSFGIYGAGLISAIQLQDLQATFLQFESETLPLKNYKAALDYLARVPGWSTGWLRFHFYESKQKMAEIEPLADRFIQDILRGSPLSFYAAVLDSLLRDANQLGRIRRDLFGRNVGVGLRTLNPGLARGKLRLEPSDHHDFDPQGIYLLPETIAALPPVAGILTAGEGNPLSHVQLLARNLGIPNVIVDESLIPELTGHQNQKIILAASPAGSVQLVLDTGQLEKVFQKANTAPSLIRPDLQKLNLETRDFIPLSQLRATDSGRIVGPKAANLGELYHHYPKSVADGLAIPFGVFRSLLDQPAQNNKNQTIFEWMEAEYAAMQTMPPGSARRMKKMESLRKQLENYILNADPGDEFRRSLAAAMDTTFGADGTYGVFVRSDTNVEDLPGFTGAGLNKTILNVMTFENVLAAIPRVWASPFSKRAFAWRQSHMDHPQHVYSSVLLMRSIPSEKSGVMVTRDIDTGEPGWLSVAVNEGVGGAVDGQAAESLRINIKTGEVRRLAQATTPWRRVLKPFGGMDKKRVEGTGTVLSMPEIKALINLAQDLPHQYPSILDANGNQAPADIEFGFVKGKLELFQIRPFLENTQTRSNEYLISLDKNLLSQGTQTVKLDQKPL